MLIGQGRRNPSLSSNGMDGNFSFGLKRRGWLTDRRLHREDTLDCFCVVIMGCGLAHSPRINRRQGSTTMAIKFRVECGCRSPKCRCLRTNGWVVRKIHSGNALGASRKCNCGHGWEIRGVERD